MVPSTRRSAFFAAIPSVFAIATVAQSLPRRASATTDAESKLLSTEDRLELMGMPARYGNAIDDRDWDALRSIFTHDAVFIVLPSRSRLEGLEGIVTYMDTTAAHPLSHLTLNTAIDVSGEKVLMRFRALLPVAEADGGPGPWRVAFGFYYDTVVKTSAGWRVKYRLFTRAPRDMRPTQTDIERHHGLLKLLEADRKDAAEWLKEPYQ
jgi:ketosteroid isomerase-like protein